MFPVFRLFLDDKIIVQGRTLHSPTHYLGLHLESMGSPRGLHFHFCHYSKSPCGLYAESMKTPHGVHMDFAKFMDSMKTCDQVSCGLLWTPSEVHGLSVDCRGLLQKSMDSPWTPSEIRGLRPHII